MYLMILRYFGNPYSLHMPSLRGSILTVQPLSDHSIEAPVQTVQGFINPTKNATHLSSSSITREGPDDPRSR